MNALFFLYVTSSVFLLEPPSYTEAADDGQRDDCIRGFMSRDRIDTLLNRAHIQLQSFPHVNRQAIIPGINFTCSGNILSWIFGAAWNGNTESFTELQIWRSNGDGSYTKVGNTTIMTEEDKTQFYEYPLSSPLPFQEGDILGYYQPSEMRSQLRLQYESRDGHTEYSDDDKDSAASYLGLNQLGRYSSDNQVLISVKTDSPGCGCGFMSVDRMRILLGIVPVRKKDRRQQITPDMNFTCDGVITKWIIGAEWTPDRSGADTLYPELQLWRKTGNDIYQRINGTIITIETERDDRVYEYDNFPPIPFQTGDILGVFIPQEQSSIIRLRSEDGYGPTNYYLSTRYDVTMSPFETIDLHQNIQSDIYHPLVTVEISIKSSPTTISPATPTDMPSNTSATDAATATTPPDESTESGSQLLVYASVGATVVLVVCVLGGCLFCVCRRRKVSAPSDNGDQDNSVYKSKDVGGISNITACDNVAYGMNKKEMEMSSNVAYDATKSTSFTGEDEYDYIPTTDGNDIITTSPNDITPTIDNVPVSSNQAYGIVQH